LALAAGCASNSEGEPSPQGDGAATATSSADSPQAVSDISEEEAREVAEKVLLRLKDFPVGWSQLPPEQDEEDPDLGLPEECRTFFEQEMPPGAILDIDSPKFEGPDEEEVDSGATVYVDADAARQAFLDARQFMDRCKDPFREAFTKYLQQLYQEKAQESGQSIEVVAFTMDLLSFPPYGDESFSTRMSFTVNVGSQTLDFYLDMFSWRVDRIEGDMSFSTQFEIPDIDEEQRLAQIIEERLNDAVKDLD